VNLKYVSKCVDRLTILILTIINIGTVVTGPGMRDCWFFSHPPSRDMKSLWSSICKLDGLSSQTFSGQVDLETLNFTNNGLTGLPDGVFKPLTNIKEIIISSNNLSSIDLNQFASNTELQKLNLQNNMIETIETIHSGGSISVTELWLQDNKLVNIFELCKLQNLRYVSLSNNPTLNFDNFKFNCWNQLRELHLKNVNLKSLHNNYQIFAGLKNLYFLNLKQNELNIFCVVNFPELPALGILLIENNMLHNLNVTELKIKFKNLKSLGLFGNPLICTYFEAIVESSIDLKINLKHLQDIKCINRSITIEVSVHDECILIPDRKYLDLKTNIYLQFFLVFSLFVIDLLLITVNFS
jgi:Leucine rich repeat